MQQQRLTPTVLVTSNPELGTTELDDSYLDIVTYQGREFQKYSIDNRICFTPVDDVGLSVVPRGKSRVDIETGRN